MIIEISVAVIALAFFCLAFYLFFVLRDLRYTLRNFNGFLMTVEPHLDTLIKETSQLTSTSKNIALELQKRIEAFDPLLKSVHHFGESLEHGTSFYKKKSELKHSLREEPELWDRERQIYKIVDLIELGIIFWQTFKKRS